jgi:hypothetical protein
MSSWYYLYPSPPRMVEAEAAAALLDLAATAANPGADLEEAAVLALTGEERGLGADIAPPAGGFPRSPMDMRRLAVDALRRGAILIAKLSLEFRLLGFLEIRKTTALRLLERAVVMVPLGTLVEVIQITPDPGAEMGIAVHLVPFVEGIQILRGLPGQSFVVCRQS